MKHREKATHVLFAGNATKELRVGKLCRPKTAVKVQRHLLTNSEQTAAN